MKMGYRRSSVRKISYYNPDDPTFFGEDIDPGDGLYGTVWFGFPEDGENAFNIEAVEQGDGTLKCDVMSPEDYDHGNGYIGVDSVDSFTATDWGNMYDVFNQRFIFGPLGPIINNYFSALYDDDDHDEFASVNTASRNPSVKRSYISEFDTWGESVDSYNEDGPFHATIAYGEPYNADNSVTMEAVGDNGVDGPVNCKVLDISWDNVVDTFQAETWDEAVREFGYRCRQYEYDEYLESDDEEFLRLNGIDASRKTSANIDYEYYGAIYEPSNGVDGIAYYGPENDKEDSLTIEIVGNDQTGYDCRIFSPSGENILGEFTATTWDLIPDFLADVVDSNGLDEYLDRYLESVNNYNSWINEVRGSTASKRIRSSRVHRTSKTAKRKMTMKEKLALINEDKLDEEDDPINPFF